jgi:hypothetical protein
MTEPTDDIDGELTPFEHYQALKYELEEMIRRGADDADCERVMEVMDYLWWELTEAERQQIHFDFAP